MLLIRSRSNKFRKYISNKSKSDIHSISEIHKEINFNIIHVTLYLFLISSFAFSIFFFSINFMMYYII